MGQAKDDEIGSLVDRFVDAIGDWSRGSGPTWRKLATATASAIERGSLAEGTRLPPERSLARAQGIGRSTLVNAYVELIALGLVERRAGSGTYVATGDRPRLPDGREGTPLVERLAQLTERDVDEHLIDLSISVLHDARGLPATAVNSPDLLAIDPPSGHQPWGSRPLRQLIAAHLTDHGLETHEHQVIVTTGAHQGIAMAAACWVRPGNDVVIDDPSYPGARSAFIAAGGRIVPTPVDHRGVRVDELARRLAQEPALAYVQALHSPTGALLDGRRRREIALLVEEHEVPLVEDMALADLAWHRPPPPIASFAPDAPIAVVGSLSKLYWGGLRLGYVRVPDSLALRFARINATHDLGTSAVSQLFAERLLKSRPPREMTALRVAELQTHYEVMAAALNARLPAWTWHPPAGGLSMWVDIKVAAERFGREALRNGVAVATPRDLAASDTFPNHVRLSFARHPDELVIGVDRLATAWHACAP